MELTSSDKRKSKKIEKLRETLRKESHGDSQVISSSGQSFRDDSMVEHELKKIYEKINSFTLEQFQDLRGEIKRQGFNQMLQRVTNQLDQEELPSEMTITEDHRKVIINNFETFVASKRLGEVELRPSIIEPPKVVQTLERKLQLNDGTRSTIVTCTGFNCQAPKLVFSRERSACKGVLDLGTEEQEIGGPIFIKLMTTAIL